MRELKANVAWITSYTVSGRCEVVLVQLHIKWWVVDIVVNFHYRQNM